MNLLAIKICCPQKYHLTAFARWYAKNADSTATGKIAQTMNSAMIKLLGQYVMAKVQAKVQANLD